MADDDAVSSTRNLGVNQPKKIPTLHGGLDDARTVERKKEEISVRISF